MEGRVVAGDAAAIWDGATFDSRAVRGGELFFALPGEKTDGHRFAAQALAAGAAAVVVHRDVRKEDVRKEDLAASRGAVIRVDDTFEALHALARHLRRHGEPRHVVAITGSVGKTTTKDLLHAMLEHGFRVAKNEGNLNNLYGFPLSLLRLPERTEWMVAEMGMSTPGELSRLSRLARPEVVVFTCVRPVHLEFFPAGLRGVAEAKAELLEGLVPGGLVVANAGDPEVVRFVRRHVARQAAEHPGEAPPRVVWFGRGAVDGGDVPTPQVSAENLVSAADGEAGSRFELVAAAGLTPDGEAVRLPVHLTLHGAYNVDNALAAAACALALGANPRDVAAALAAAAPAAGRGVVHRLAGGAVVVDDSYNSSPDALERALAAAVDLAAGSSARRCWAVLGDMLELGPEAPRFHQAAGRRAAELGFTPVAGVGELAREITAAAAAAGAEAPWFADAAGAAGWAAGELAPGDVVLVKGSRGVGLDRVVAGLLERSAPTNVAAAGGGGEGAA
jgi:UDP-N-acetylmuramoyl-tripeptide--D-alanyl-D-alanine ligase